MPGENGNEAYEDMRKVRPETNVIFMSGYDENIIHRQQLLNKSLNFIQKPFKSQAFLEKVREALDSAGRCV